MASTPTRIVGATARDIPPSAGFPGTGTATPGGAPEPGVPDPAAAGSEIAVGTNADVVPDPDYEATREGRIGSLEARVDMIETILRGRFSNDFPPLPDPV